MLLLSALMLLAGQDPAGALVEAERPTAREPDGTSFARVFEERWASERACLVGFHARGRASWTLPAETEGEHALWLRYASRGGGRIAVGLGSLAGATLVEAEIPGTGAYEGKDAWAWTRVWRGALDVGEHEFTVRGGPLRLDALWLGPAGAAPPALGPPPVPARDPEQLAAIENALRAALPAAALAREARAPAWYEATRVSIHTRLSPRWRERPAFVEAADAFAGIGARAYVRHVRTMGEGAWWPSAVGDVEPWAADEPVTGMVERAHARGLRLVAYYRHMEDRGVARDHSDWLCRDDLGRPYDDRPVPHVCLNSPYADELIVRLQELVARGVDGIYFDEHHQPREGCFCGFCRARWDRVTGGAPFPESIDPEDPLYRLFGLFTDVTVERFFARVRAEVRAGHDDLAILIGNNRAPDLFDRHASARLAGFADAIKTEYGKGDSHVARGFFAQNPDAAAPPRAALLGLGWAYCRDMAGGRPPHVWINGVRDATEASAAAAAVVAWGGVANLDCKEARIPDAETFAPAVALGNELGDLLAGTRPVRRVAVHVSEAARDATPDDRAAWDTVLGATNAAWAELVSGRVPCGFVTDGELRDGIGADVAVLVLPAPDALDAQMGRAVERFVALGGVLVTALDELEAAIVQRSVPAAPAGTQVVLHRNPSEGREVLFIVNDPGWVWSDRRELPGGDPVALPDGVDVVPAPLRAAEVDAPPGFVLARSHPAVLAITKEPDLTLRDHDRRGDERLFAGRFDEAIADYDHTLAARPEDEPYHWRRGIAYYYAGRYAEGIAQFDVHRTVNPADVENAAWHFLCKARLDGAEAARAALLPVGRDGRVPMSTVYELFAGRATPEDVLAAGAGSADGAFFAHLYVGLYHEALGDFERARQHIELAATRHARPHYMGRVARVHAALLED